MDEDHLAELESHKSRLLLLNYVFICAAVDEHDVAEDVLRGVVIQRLKQLLFGLKPHSLDPLSLLLISLVRALISELFSVYAFVLVVIGGAFSVALEVQSFPLLDDGVTSVLEHEICYV